LSHAAYQEFSLRYISQILAGLRRDYGGARVPNIVFTKGGGLWLEHIANCGCDAVGLDWTIDIAEARRRVGHKVALQGNLDPAVLFATPEVIAVEVEKVLAATGGEGHVQSHGISQFTPPENALALVEAVHSISRKLREHE
jgi:uroporphyrinogen decarboxylase